MPYLQDISIRFFKKKINLKSRVREREVMENTKAPLWQMKTKGHLFSPPPRPTIGSPKSPAVSTLPPGGALGKGSLRGGLASLRHKAAAARYRRSDVASESLVSRMGKASRGAACLKRGKADWAASPQRREGGRETRDPEGTRSNQAPPPRSPLRGGDRERLRPIARDSFQAPGRGETRFRRLLPGTSGELTARAPPPCTSGQKRPPRQKFRRGNREASRVALGWPGWEWWL